MSRARVLLNGIFTIVLTGCTQQEPGISVQDARRDDLRRSGVTTDAIVVANDDHAVQKAIEPLLLQELTCEQAVAIALLNNRNLRATYEDLNIARADIVQAGVLRNPMLSGEIRFATSGGGTGVVLDASQDLLSILAMPLRKGRSEAVFEAVRARVSGAILDLVYETRVAFYDYEATEQRREMHESVRTAMAASYELAQRLFEAGNYRALDVSNERAMAEQAKLDLAASEADVVQKREQLTTLMGLWGEAADRWRAAPRLPQVPADEIPAAGILRQALEASTDLAALRRDAEVAAQTAGIALQFGGISTLEAGAAAEREIDGEWSLGPAISLPIPLLDQGQAAYTAAQARYRQAAERLYARAVELRSAVRVAYNRVNFTRDQARYYENVILPLRAQIVSETQLQYNAMQVSPFQLLMAKRDQITAGAAYVNSLREYWIARAALDQLLRGRLMPAALNQREGSPMDSFDSSIDGAAHE